MKVEVKIQEQCLEPHAVIYTKEVDPEVQRIIRYMRNNVDTIIGIKQDRAYVLNKKEICMAAVEEERMYLYTSHEKYRSKKRLYELKEELGPGFVQISKAVIVRLSACASVESGLGGMMLLYLKNGSKIYVSRHYLPAFKKDLGL